MSEKGESGFERKAEKMPSAQLVTNFAASENKWGFVPLAVGVLFQYASWM